MTTAVRNITPLKRSVMHIMNGVSSAFSAVPRAPEDPMFGLRHAFDRDTCNEKVDLGVGAYRDDNAKPWVFPIVHKASNILNKDPTLNHEYLPIAGHKAFLEASQRLMFGKASCAITERRIVSMQTLSGTGALNLGALFLSRFLPKDHDRTVYVSSPPYVNHRPLMHQAELRTELYDYYSPKTRHLDFIGLLSGLRAMPNGSVVLLHACAHNPTGVDPTRDQWKDIASVMKVKNMLPFFDSAYQGFASGSLDDDAWVVRYFAEQGFEMLVAQSYAKNFGLYGERAGCLHFVASDAGVAEQVSTQLQIIQRVTISTPPAYGARIVSLILNDESLYTQWQEEVQSVATRIKDMRALLRRELEALGTPGSWNHITDQIGMFCFTGLGEAQVMMLRDKFHVYTTTNGRISIAGLNSRNVGYTAKAFDFVVRASI